MRRHEAMCVAQVFEGSQNTIAAAVAHADRSRHWRERPALRALPF